MAIHNWKLEARGRPCQGTLTVARQRGVRVRFCIALALQLVAEDYAVDGASLCFDARGFYLEHPVQRRIVHNLGDLAPAGRHRLDCRNSIVRGPLPSVFE